MSKKPVRGTAIALASLVAILLIGFAASIYAAESQLETRLKEIRAAGDPTCLADLASGPVPPDQNAAIALYGIRDDVKALLAKATPYLRSENYKTGRPTASQLETIEAAFASYPKVIPTILEAVTLRGYDRGLDFSLPPAKFSAASLGKIQDQRAIARTLALHATVLRSQGKWDESAATAITMLRLAKHQNDDACGLTDYLVSLAVRSMAVDVANRALRGGSVSDHTRNRLDIAFALVDPIPGYVIALKAERAYGLESFKHLPIYLRWDRTSLGYLDAVGEEIRLAPAPLTTYTNCPKRAAIAKSAGTLVQHALPSFKAARGSTDRTLATIRALRVLNALLGRDDPNAAPPADLAELGLPTDVTTDPFNGKPLIVKKTAQGWIVYAIGPDLTDDGGKLDGKSDFGVGPIEEVAETE